MSGSEGATSTTPRKRKRETDTETGNETETETTQLKLQTGRKYFSALFRGDIDIESDAIHNLDHIVALGQQVFTDTNKADKWLDEDCFMNHRHRQNNPIRIPRRPVDSDASSYHHHHGETPGSKSPPQQQQHHQQNGKVAIHEEDRILYSNMKNVEYVKHTKSTVAQCIKQGQALPLFRWPVDQDGIMEERNRKKFLLRDDGDSNDNKESTTSGAGESSSIFGSFAFVSTNKGTGEGEGTSTDENWDHCYGDGIDEEEFRRRCRCMLQETRQCSSSRKTPNRLVGNYMSIQDDGVDDDNDDEHDDDESTEMKHALQELLQRCWDKALHIESNTFRVNCMNAHRDNFERGLSENIEIRIFDESNNITGGIKRDDQMCDGSLNDKDEFNVSSNLSCQAQAVMKCKELDITFDHICLDSDSSYTCQSCHKRLKYISNEQVMDHLFGTQTSKGCCWQMIQEKRRILAQGVIEREAVSIIDNLLHIVFRKIKEERSKHKDNLTSNLDTTHENAAPLNWESVCHAMMDALKKAVVLTNNGDEERSGVRTIHLDPNLPPFPLDEALMKIVLTRLIKRYVE